jgi:hypothetical protein
VIFGYPEWQKKIIWPQTHADKNGQKMSLTEFAEFTEREGFYLPSFAKRGALSESRMPAPGFPLALLTTVFFLGSNCADLGWSGS